VTDDGQTDGQTDDNHDKGPGEAYSLVVGSKSD